MEHKGLEAAQLGNHAMTTSTFLADSRAQPQNRPLGGFRFLRDLKIGPKLTLGFGILVGLTLVGVGLSVISHLGTTQLIKSTAEVRVPTALIADQAQANLLRMQADVTGYLALGDNQYKVEYQQDNQAFAANLAQLGVLAPKLSPGDQNKLAALKQAYAEWSRYPDQLFTLHDDQLAREPAYNILATQGVQLGGTILIDVGKLIDQQQLRQPSAEVVSQLADMARFQGSFSSMLSGLRGYVTTRNRVFRSEYEANFDLNQIAWDRLRADAPNLLPAQQALIIDIENNNSKFSVLPDQMFSILEGDQWRLDLYLFRTQTLPTADTMRTALGGLTSDQQSQVVLEMAQGEHSLAQTNQLTELGGGAILILAIVIGLLLHRNIARPVRRLTDVAEQVKAGDLTVQAQVEGGDEIGILAATFNRMTGQLSQILREIQREKKRADDLLHVVIPIGVQLSGEKDFNRLLENILVEAKSFCHARAGVLFLRTPEDCLEYVIVRDDDPQVAMGGTTGEQVPFKPLPMQGANGGEVASRSLAVRAAVDGASINLPRAVPAGDFDYSEAGSASEESEDKGESFLAIPLENNIGHVIGVLQLAYARDPDTAQAAVFDANLQQMMESFSSLAVAAVEAYMRERGLQLQIQELRIEIDEVKRQQQVREIVESDFFQDLQGKAQAMRERHGHSK